jgi:hypothetical protein
MKSPENPALRCAAAARDGKMDLKLAWDILMESGTSARHFSNLEAEDTCQTSINDPEVRAAFDSARAPGAKRVMIGGKPVDVPTPFPSPADWRDQWIYFLLVDRFNNPQAAPRFAPFDGEMEFQSLDKAVILSAASPFLLVRNRPKVDDAFP